MHGLQHQKEASKHTKTVDTKIEFKHLTLDRQHYVIKFQMIMIIKTKRIYEKYSPENSFRSLIDDL